MARQGEVESHAAADAPGARADAIPWIAPEQAFVANRDLPHAVWLDNTPSDAGLDGR